jgi:signal transduction histidine kinase
MKLLKDPEAYTHPCRQQEHLSPEQYTVGTFVMADANMVTVIIRNLLSNALKFTANGGAIEIYSPDPMEIWR